MSFSSGTFSINTSGQPVVAATTISASVFNAFTADIATGLSTCMLKDGTQTATAGIPFYAGTVSLPGIYLSTETSTGFYRIGANNWGFAVSGVKVLDWASTGVTLTGTETVTSASASALTVGRLGATTPALQVDASTATSITGIKIKSAASTGGVAVSAIGETNVNLTVDAAGSGTIVLGGTSTGAITLTRATTLSAALTYGGVALTNAVTGTGKMVLDTSPTLVTPALGTPSSGTVTNLTGTASININGTVGATTPASGAFTTVTSSGDAAFGAAIRSGTAGLTNVSIGADSVLMGHAADTVGSTLNISQNANFVSSSWKYINSYYASNLQMSAGGFDVRTSNASGTAGNTITWITPFSVSNAGIVSTTNTTDATSSTAASVTMAGGLAVAKKINVGTDAAIGGTLAVTGGISSGGGSVYSGGELLLTVAGSGGTFGIATTADTGAATMYFDHRATGNTGKWTWRNGNAAGTAQMTLSATAVLNIENGAGDIKKTGTAYTNPDYVLEHWATGKIEKYLAKEGAREYTGLMPLEQVEQFAKTNWHLPRFGQSAGHGIFSGSDSLLASVEESYIHLFTHERRINALAARLDALEKRKP